MDEHSVRQIGSTDSQTVWDTDEPIGRLLCITQGSSKKDVPISVLVDSITECLALMHPAQKLIMLDLYTMVVEPNEVDTGDEVWREKITAFMAGLLIGKFLSNTNSAIESCHIDDFGGEVLELP
jgi:hypothetical protein